MSYDFETSPDLRAANAIKWTMYPEDVLPMWIADMDYACAQPIRDALTERIQTGILGYSFDMVELREALVERMQRLYNWEIKAEWIMFIPGMVTTINMVTRAIGKAGDGVLMDTPVYPPFLIIPGGNTRFAQMVDMDYVTTGAHTYAYELNFERFERAITKQTSLYYLCNPHNPAGKVYTRAELERLADICLRNNVTIVSDEIHSDLILEGRHIPIASLSTEVADKTLTLIAPSKTFNLAGLCCSIAIVSNEAMRKAVMEATWASGLHVNTLGLVAADAAYRHAGDWLEAMLQHLRGNRDFLTAFVAEHLPGVKTTIPMATYMSFLDFSAIPTPDNMPFHKFCADVAKIGLNAGNGFRNVNAASDRDSFVRLNFACPRWRLEDGLLRLKTAIIPLAAPV